MNILIVDDEEEIREGLCIMIGDLQKKGVQVQVVAVCSDGYAALNEMMGHPVDLVISDVRMPGMDGLALTQTIAERYPETQMIMLSGYSEFAYAKQAMRIGVADYLVKPVNGGDLEAAIRLIGRRSAQKRAQSAPWTWEQFAGDEAPCKAVVVCDPDETSSLRALQFGTVQTLAWMFHKTLGEVAENIKGVRFIQESGKRESSNVVLGVCAPSDAELDYALQQFTSEVRQFWMDKVRIPVSFGIAIIPPEHGREESRTGYTEACTALLQRLWNGGGVWRYCPKEPDRSAAARLPLKQLQSAWDVGDYDGYLTALTASVQTLLQQNESQPLLHGVETILLPLIDKLQLFQAATAGAAARDLALFMEKLLWTRNRDDLCRSILEWVNVLIEKTSPEKQEGQLLGRAKQYIRDHLHEPMTLADVGQAIFVSRHYLSRLFRERAGTTFLEYVTELRMEEAKRLLKEPGIKIYEVAERVGYGNWKNFSRIFKERTNYGPAEYRANLSPD
ncbi:response regulator [Paenibacillus sp. GCM10027626]|uniref:response regulator n=1 Tax=Paenibacillus sp. GCM10027626 TaxID=3273411 RepID=UPI00362D0CB3